MVGPKYVRKQILSKILCLLFVLFVITLMTPVQSFAESQYAVHFNVPSNFDFQNNESVFLNDANERINVMSGEEVKSYLAMYNSFPASYKKDVVYLYSIADKSKNKVEFILITSIVGYNYMLENYISNNTLSEYAAYCKSMYVSVVLKRKKSQILLDELNAALPKISNLQGQFLQKSALNKDNKAYNLYMKDKYRRLDDCATNAFTDYGRHVNELCEDGRTPLMHAVASQNIEAVQDMLKIGANVNIKDNEGQNAFFKSAFYPNLEIVKLLSKGQNINQQDNEGFSALLAAANKGNLAVAKYLVSIGADVNIRASQGVNAFMSAAYSDNVELIEFLSKGQDINQIGDVLDRVSATAIAAALGNLKVLEYLLNRNADPNLVYAGKKFGFANMDVVDMYIKHGVAIQDLLECQKESIISAGMFYGIIGVMGGNVEEGKIYKKDQEHAEMLYDQMTKRFGEPIVRAKQARVCK